MGTKLLHVAIYRSCILQLEVFLRDDEEDKNDENIRVTKVDRAADERLCQAEHKNVQLRNRLRYWSTLPGSISTVSLAGFFSFCRKQPLVNVGAGGTITRMIRQDKALCLGFVSHVYTFCACIVIKISIKGVLLVLNIRQSSLVLIEQRHQFYFVCSTCDISRLTMKVVH